MISVNFINCLPQKGYWVDKDMYQKVGILFKNKILHPLSTYCFDCFNGFLSSKIIVTLSLSWNLQDTKRSLNNITDKH